MLTKQAYDKIELNLKKSLIMNEHLNTNQRSSFGYESPTTEVFQIITEGVLCESSKLDILDWQEHPDAL